MLLDLHHYTREGNNVQVTLHIKTHCNSYPYMMNHLFYIIYFKLSVFSKTLRKFIFANVSYIDHECIYKSIKSHNHKRRMNTFDRHCQCKQHIINKKLSWTVRDSVKQQ